QSGCVPWNLQLETGARKLPKITDFPAMRPGNFPRQRQPEPGAVRASRYERLEPPGRYVGGDTGPCIANLQDHDGIERISGRGYRDGAAARRMLQRVGNQVVQRPAERARIE